MIHTCARAGVTSLPSMSAHPVIRETVANDAHLAIHHETLQVEMQLAQNSQAGGIVATTRFQSDKPRLDDILASNTVGTAQLVGLLEDLQGASHGLAPNFKLHGNTLSKVDGEASGLIGSVQGINCALPHVLGGLHVCLLENTGLV